MKINWDVMAQENLIKAPSKWGSQNESVRENALLIRPKEVMTRLYGRYEGPERVKLGREKFTLP